MNETVYVTWMATYIGIRAGAVMQKTTSPPGYYVRFPEGDDWIPGKYVFQRYTSAVKSAERQRKAKIVQLEAQIKRLQEMEFK